MKKLIGLSIFFVLLATLSVSYGQKTETRLVQPFDKIKIGGLVQVYLQEGDRENFRLEVKGISPKDVISTVENGVLTVRTEGNHNGEDIKAYVTYRQLNSVSVGGAAKLFGKSTIKGKELNVATTGNGDAFLNVDVDSLLLSMEGGGNLTISGKAKSEKITMQGRVNGTLDKTELITSK